MCSVNCPAECHLVLFDDQVISSDIDVREANANRRDISFVALRIGNPGIVGIMVGEIGAENLVCYGQVPRVPELRETADDNLVGIRVTCCTALTSAINPIKTVKAMTRSK